MALSSSKQAKKLTSSTILSITKITFPNRRFYNHVNGYDSTFGSIKYGIPQGSVLGPLFYTIYNSDMSVDKLTVATYTDGTAILSSNESIIEAPGILQRHLAMAYKMEYLSQFTKTCTCYICTKKRR